MSIPYDYLERVYAGVLGKLIGVYMGRPIEGWTHDPNDEALLDLLPVLDSLRFTGDVRHILGLRGF